VIIEDVIIAVPDYARALVAGYCQEANTRAWQEAGSAQGAGASGNGLQRILQKLWRA